jgi:hypothetical protein
MIFTETGKLAGTRNHRPTSRTDFSFGLVWLALLRPPEFELIPVKSPVG